MVSFFFKAVMCLNCEAAVVGVVTLNAVTSGAAAEGDVVLVLSD